MVKRTNVLKALVRFQVELPHGEAGVPVHRAGPSRHGRDGYGVIVRDRVQNLLGSGIGSPVSGEN